MLSKYTILLNTLIETNFDLGLNNYPIFNESYRNVLNQKIIDRYLFNEICCDEPLIFRHKLNMKLNLIMPYYNELYKQMEKDLNFFDNVDLTEIYSGLENKTSANTSNATNTNNGTTTNNGESTDTTSNTSNSTSNGKGITSDTPQSMLSADIPSQAQYASTANLDETLTTQTDNGTNNNIFNNSTNQTATSEVNSEFEGTDDTQNNYTKTLKGKNGGLTNIEIYKLIQDNYINIDNSIINELRNLFIKIY